RQVMRLGALVARVEGEAAPIDPVKEDHADRRLAQPIDRCQRHRVRLRLPSFLREREPAAELDQWIEIDVRFVERLVGVHDAVSGATAFIPGLGTLLALGAVTGQALYALEQEAELVLAIAMIYGHELTGSDARLMEALVVIGLAGGGVKLRDDVLMAGGQQI